VQRYDFKFEKRTIALLFFLRVNVIYELSAKITRSKDGDLSFSLYLCSQEVRKANSKPLVLEKILTSWTIRSKNLY
jgi:hypothetical protein